jgi:lactate dehydrogenase-like 2-hydroxyacid dehydrogenase
MGDIGFKLAKKAYAALGMKIYYHDAIRKSKEQEDVVEATFCSTLVELVQTADCVVLLVPFAGRKLVTADLLSNFKKGSRFINVARGQLVDEEALADALESGHISAAGLDVHADEPNVNKRLGQMRNVSLTCHNGGGAAETRVEFERLVMENADRLLTGKEPLTPVNLHLMKHLN